LSGYSARIFLTQGGGIKEEKRKEAVGLQPEHKRRDKGAGKRAQKKKEKSRAASIFW